MFTKPYMGQMLAILVDKMGCFNQIATEKYTCIKTKTRAWFEDIWNSRFSACELQLNEFVT